MPKSGSGNANEDGSDDYSNAEGYHENYYRVCDFTERSVRAEHCDVKVHDGDFD